jgi:hypothetical protein
VTQISVRLDRTFSENGVGAVAPPHERQQRNTQLGRGLVNTCRWCAASRAAWWRASPPPSSWTIW